MHYSLKFKIIVIKNDLSTYYNVYYSKQLLYQSNNVQLDYFLIEYLTVLLKYINLFSKITDIY